MIKATVCLPTYNGQEFLAELLKQLFKQECAFEFEVLIIDSGSTDDTLKIISKYPKVRLHQIPNTEFGHGKTRNLGAKMAKGEFVVYLTQDAVPAHKYWLESMLEPFAVSDKVYCVFGKQVPRGNCTIHIKREVYSVFKNLGPDHAIMLHRKNTLNTDRPTKDPMTFFSDVNSAVRRDYILNKIPFRDVKYAEDQALGTDALEAGYIKAYAPMGSVFHSHNYPLKKFFHRKFDEYVGLADTGVATPHYGPLTAVLSVFKSTLLDWNFIARDGQYKLKHKAYNFVVSPLYNIALVVAVNTAGNKKLRDKHRQRLSLEARSKPKS